MGFLASLRILRADKIFGNGIRIWGHKSYTVQQAKAKMKTFFVISSHMSDQLFNPNIRPKHLRTADAV